MAGTSKESANSSWSKTVIISLGGSLIVPDGVDTSFLWRFRELVLDHKTTRFVIVCGGGGICRTYQKAARELGVEEHNELDWIGIRSTKMNAELVRTIFHGKAYPSIIDDPSARIDSGKRIIIGSGFEPGCSSDMDAVLLAKNFNATTVINLSNISHAYTKDPKKHSDAKPILETGWSAFQKIIGTRWVPGGNFPFDPKASALAKKNRLRVIIAKGSDLVNLDNILSGKHFIGTVIGPE